jgi:hypothetical protein
MRLNTASSTVVVGACLLCAAASPAQQGEKRTCDVPLVVTRFDPSSRKTVMVKDLGVSDLAVQLGTEWLSVESATIDDGAKRVALILDGGGRVSKEEWEMQTELAASFVEHGRRGDAFALLVAGSRSAPGPFEPAKKAGKRLRKLKSSRGASTNSNGSTYDALLAASNLLTPPRFGDSIFLFGRADDSGSAASLDQVQELVLKNGLRFCGLSLSASLTSKLLDLSRTTGCVFEFTSLKVLSMPAVQGPFGPIPPQLSLRKAALGEAFAGIAEPYRVGIPASSIQAPIDLKFDVPTADERKIDVRDAYYPHFVYPCSPARP